MTDFSLDTRPSRGPGALDAAVLPSEGSGHSSVSLSSTRPCRAPQGPLLSVYTSSVMMTAASGGGLARLKGLSTMNCAGRSETSRERTLQKQGEGTEPWTWKEKEEGGEGD